MGNLSMQIDFKRRTLSLLATGLLLMAFAVQAAPTQTVLVMGDSLSAEYGLERGSGWVALVTQKMASEHPQWHVVNASISGETSAGGKARLPALLALHKPKVVVIELGANDALRGLPIQALRDNLIAMVSASQAAGAKVLLLGMQVPPNFGKRYTQDFANSYAQVSQTQHTALLPFFLRGVADRPDAKDWFQPDGVHPLAKAHPVIAELVWPQLKPLLLGR